MKVRQIFAKDAWPPSMAIEHVFAVSEEGELYERFSDWPPGKWSKVPLDEPDVGPIATG